MDRTAATLRVRGKYGKMRLLPLHRSVLAGLTGYLEQRTRLFRRGLPRPAHFQHGAADGPLNGAPDLPHDRHGRRDREGEHPLPAPTVRPTSHLRCEYDAGRLPVRSRPRRRPADPIIGWMGHTDLSDTCWYLTGTTELLPATAADRLTSTDMPTSSQAQR